MQSSRWKIIGTESNTTHERTFCNSLRRRSHKQDTELDIVIQVLETQLIGFVDKSPILSHILSVLIQRLALNYRLSISNLNKITQRDASQVPRPEQVFAYVDDFTIPFTIQSYFCAGIYRKHRGINDFEDYRWPCGILRSFWFIDVKPLELFAIRIDTSIRNTKRKLETTRFSNAFDAFSYT